MSCFRQNVTTSRNILEFADDQEFAAQIRMFYRFWVSSISFSAMVLNLLLCLVIVRCPVPSIKISPMLVFNSVIDFSLAAFYFITGRYPIFGYGRLLFLNNEGVLDLSNRLVAFVIHVLVSVVTLACWYVIVSQFVYRLLLVKYNEQPRGRRLVCFVAFCFTIYALHTIGVLYDFTTGLAPNDIEDSIKLVNHYGFNYTPYNIFGTVMRPGKPTNFAVNLAQMFSSISYIVVFYCAWSIHRLLHQSAALKNPTTQRLNRAMNRTVVTMGLIASSNVLPLLAISLVAKQCRLNPVFSLSFTTCMLFASFMNPIVAFTFILPYRQRLGHLLTCSYHKSAPKNTILVGISSYTRY